MTRTASRRRVLRALGAFAGLVLASGTTACTSPDVALRDAFGVERPAHVTVDHYDTAILARDGWDIWVVSPVDDAFLRDVVKTARLARRQQGEPEVTGLVSDWPAWWRPARIEALPEAYEREDDAEHWRVWVDRRENRLYLQWFGT